MKKMILFRGLLIGLLIVVNGTLTLDAQAVDRSQSAANFRLRRNVRTSYARTMKHARTAPQALPTKH